MVIARRRVGLVRAGQVLSAMIAWEVAREALGDEWPDGIEAQVQAYSAWWRQSERTGWRELSRFRAAFPGESTPTRIMGLSRDAWDERRGVAGLGAVKLAAA
jgi:hypothetical protein